MTERLSRRGLLATGSAALALAAAPAALAQSAPRAGVLLASVAPPAVQPRPPGAEVAADPVARFYAARGNRPAWTDRSGFAPAGQMLVARLARAAEDGLDPAWYALPDPAQRFDPADAAATLAADTALSRAAAAFLGDLGGGRVRALPDRPDILRAPLGFDLAEALGVLATAADPGLALERYAPADPAYRTLRAELGRVRAVLAGADAPPPVPGGPTIDPGERDPRVALVRAQLAASHGVALPPAADPERYDAELLAVVKAFQTRSGLLADGRMGRATIQALNEGPAQRIRQLRVAMDMRRAAPPPEPLAIEVNVPEYLLRVYAQGRTGLSMAVVVGRPSRATPMLRTHMTHALFNPPWGVPERLAKEDMLPRLRRDPQAMAERGFRIFQRVDGRMVELDPRGIDWHAVRGTRFPYYIRQDPGDANALGKLRLSMPNKEDIFMHDTPDRHLFRREARAYSSGCIRLEKPLELTALLLAENEGWNEERIEAAIARQVTAGVPARRQIPVVVTYRTVRVEAEGRIAYLRDIYGLDAAYAQAMENPPRPLPRTQLAAR